MSNNKFNFYTNTVALSFDNPKKKKEMKCDFLLEGNLSFLTNGLIEQMERHTKFAELITNAAYNYLERNNKSPKP